MAVVMVKRVPPKFPGFLNRPIPKLVVFPFGVPPSDTNKEQKVAYDKRVTELRLEKLVALLKHYGIPQSKKHCWLMLSFCLAVDCVPGMSIVDRSPRRARPKEKWGQELVYQLCGEIDAIRALKHRRSIVAAIEIARIQQPQKWGKYTRSSKRWRSIPDVA
jgi:hypothetical protein